MKIAMWSGPRNISTALLRSFGNRPDTYVTDEPFYACYLHETGKNHPIRDEIIKSGKINWDEVVDNITGDVPLGKIIWYQKHMAQHNLPGNDLSWIEKMYNILLIRHPMDVILSYIKKYELTNIYQLGYPQQVKLFNFLNNNIGEIPIILDAHDILDDPERILLMLCKKINIHFYKEMLTWQAGNLETDGIWGKHWYNSVKSSTGFKPYSKSSDHLPKIYEKIYMDSMEYYQQLYPHRMR